MPSSAAKLPKRPPTTSISLRVSDAHLAALSRLEARKGVQRSALIQLSIAEYIERNKR
ncbi:MAG: hypothetical protein P4L26_01970 [Terracidiphilus sp.]|nr:hypothetical protein [Terracidiphilus sp.]